MTTRQEARERYTIGWVAALRSELDAAAALLDDLHDAPEGADQRSTDRNSDIRDQRGEQNIAIASLPVGDSGIICKATSSFNLIRPLPNFRIELPVDSGSGIPNPNDNQDISLGTDVVLAGRVNNYDWEKAGGSGDKPSEMLLNRLPTGHGASFDSKTDQTSLVIRSNGHEERLNNIKPGTDDPDWQPLLWLSGRSGTGKTTIARAVASSQFKSLSLAATVFAKITSRHLHRQDEKDLMSILARQVASNEPGVSYFLKQTLDADPAIRGILFKLFIRDPLSRVAATLRTPSTMVALINTLDGSVREMYLRQLLKRFPQATTISSCHPQLLLAGSPELTALPESCQNHITTFPAAWLQTQDDWDTLETTSNYTTSTLFQGLEISTNPSSFLIEANHRPTITFLNYKTSEQNGYMGDMENDIRSVISLLDDIGSRIDPDNPTKFRHAAVSYLVNTLMGDFELDALYREATRKMHETRFVDNHRRLLRQYFLELRKDTRETAQLSAVEFLRPRYIRTLISQGIWNLVMPPNNPFRDSFDLALEQDNDELHMLNRFLGDDISVNGSPRADDTCAEDSDSTENSSSEDEETEDMLSNLEATKEFFTAGQPFQAYHDSLRRFLRSTPTSTLSSSRCIASRSQSASNLDRTRSAEANTMLEDIEVEQQSEGEHDAAERVLTEAVVKKRQQTTDLPDNIESGAAGIDLGAVPRQRMDALKGRSLGPEPNDTPPCPGGSSNPTSQGKGQSLSWLTHRCVPMVRITRVYEKALAFLSYIGLKEDDITPGHQRIRWKNNRGKSLYDDYIEHEQGALQALQDYLNSVAYLSIASSIGGSGPNLASPVSSGDSNTFTQTRISGSTDIADQCSKLTLNQKTSSVQKDLETGKSSTNTLHVLSCMDSRKHTVILNEELVTNVFDDQQLFKTLRERYFGHVGTLKRHWSLRTVHAIHFMKVGCPWESPNPLS
ncbi:unnamed protein product [Fusarium equiseti]|uniref:Nephrocystin 3-like N-terminal domain-containing protein n=1 Tax=Fusarium equiseti TaxID=61235 RepID=A0A8J2NIM4_FUSEQ|nr:unnamed protein product [Fusarium equiseti]